MESEIPEGPAHVAIVHLKSILEQEDKKLTNLEKEVDWATQALDRRQALLIHQEDLVLALQAAINILEEEL